MSSQTPPIPPHRSHRQTRSAALPTPAAASQNPQSPHHFNLQSLGSTSQPGMGQSQQPTTPPRTPQKSEYSAAAQNGSQLPESDSGQKPRSKGKNRSKNAIASPAAPRTDRGTPPLTGMQSGLASTTRPISTPSATAYAGPTFHASPAPSALPIPSFYSKSVPDSPGINDLLTQKESSSSGTSSPTPPPAKIAASQPQREESPLDFFFKADREEKARARSASSFHGTPSEAEPFLPPSESPSNKNYNTSSGNQRMTQDAYSLGNSKSALFVMELDGTNSPGKPYGPAFSTPYNERINAVRSSTTSLQSQSQSQKSQGQMQSTDRSEALKAYLFSTQTRSPPTTRPNDSTAHTGLAADQSVPSRTSRNADSSHNLPNSSAPSSRPLQNYFAHVNNSPTSRPSPRGGPRSSGLRQEVTSTPTSFHIPDQVNKPYPTPPSLPRPSRPEVQSSTSYNPAENFKAVYPNPHTAAPQSLMTSGSRSNEFQEMEDNLRRILKLEPAKDTNIQASGIGRMPEATVSVPNYIGGRIPPMNGMHNGVMGS